MARKPLIMQLALGTLIGMPLVAIIIDRFSEPVDLATMLVGHVSLWEQVLWGIPLGLAAGIGAHWIVSRSFMEKVNNRYAHLLGNFQLTWSEILFISLCAGVGEEMLFRGAIQPLLGLVLTSMVFVAIHGYINPMNWRLSVYGFYMTAVIMAFGVCAERLGLVSSMVAHTLVDVYLLYRLQQTAQTLPPMAAGEGEADEEMD